MQYVCLSYAHFKLPENIIFFTHFLTCDFLISNLRPQKTIFACIILKRKPTSIKVQSEGITPMEQG